MDHTGRRAALMLMGGGCAMLLARGGGAQPSRDLPDTLAAEARFNNFLEFVSKSGIGDRLRLPGPYTVFAPVNAAWSCAQLPLLQELVGRLGAGESCGTTSPDMERLRMLVAYHVLPGEVPEATFRGGTHRLPTLDGVPIQVSLADGAVVLSNPLPRPRMLQGVSGPTDSRARLLPPAIRARNGVIHPIDAVLFP